MGFKLNVELETTSGPTSEFYIRIENWKINRSSNLVTFTTTAWLNKEQATNFNRKYADDKSKNAVGLVGSKVIYYEDELSKGEKVDIKNLYSFEMIKEQEVEIPVYKTKTVQVEVPYISFDEQGDEITLYRTVEEEKKVKVKTVKETKKVIDISVLDDLTGNSYKVLKEELKKFFPPNKIIKT
jgi:hypothetical protein